MLVRARLIARLEAPAENQCGPQIIPFAKPYQINALDRNSIHHPNVIHGESFPLGSPETATILTFTRDRFQLLYGFSQEGEYQERTEVAILPAV